MHTDFRATEHDRALIEQLAHEGETTNEVIRRALHNLEREQWHVRAQEAATRIDADGEDLSVEPDAW